MTALEVGQMLRRWWLVVALVLAVLFFGGEWYVEGVNRNHPAAWPMAGGSAGLRHYTPATFPSQPKELWSFPISEADYTAPLIGADGTIYVDTATEVVAVDPQGKRRWAWRSPQGISSLALSRQGELYAVDTQNIYALDSSGRMQWRAQLPGPPTTPVVVAQGGNLYYAGGRQVHSLNDRGSHRWSREVGNVVAGPVESSGGLILVATATELLALRPGGEQAWSRTLGTPALLKPLAAGADGSIYLRTASGLVVLNEKGEITSEAPPALYSANLAVGAGVVQEGRVRRDARGQILWTVAPGFASPDPVGAILDAKGRILLVERRAPVRSANSRTAAEFTYRLWSPEGREEWVLDAAQPLSEPAVDAKGNLCFVGRLSAGRGAGLICVGDGAPSRQ